MQELDDIALLREYAVRDSEEAFAALVTRHIDRVYSVALRHTGNPHHSEEITQAVFVILARKSKHLRKGVILEGWLYRTARLTALTHIRSEIRRARREQEAYMQNVLNENESKVWSQITPLLDAALAGLNEADRNAVVLRFFYGKSMSEIGTILGASEDTARMRINRAIEKLRKYFSKHGVTSTTATIAGAISANSVQVAPVALAKTATVIGVAALFAVGTTTIAVKKIEGHKTNTDVGSGNLDWQVQQITQDRTTLEKMPPLVKILPAKFSDSSGERTGRGGKMTGINRPGILGARRRSCWIHVSQRTHGRSC
jgi:RNA polymerase sigma factor (sigma-70 family)